MALKNKLINKEKIKRRIKWRETAKTKIDEIAKRMRELAEEYGIAFDTATYAKPKEPFESVIYLRDKINHG